MESSFSTSMHRKLFMIRLSFAELSVSTFAPLYYTLSWLCRPARRTFFPKPIVWSKSNGWRRGSLRVAADCLMRDDYVNRLGLRGDLIAAYKAFSAGFNLDPSLCFIPPVRPGLRGHPFKVLQLSSEESRPFQYES